MSLSLDQTTGTVNITNTLSIADGYYQEPSTQAPNDPGTAMTTAAATQTTAATTETAGTAVPAAAQGRSSSSARTGDDNQIFLYAGLLAAAVIVAAWS